MDHPVAVGRYRWIGKYRLPLSQPLGLCLLDLRHHLFLDAALSWSQAVAYRVDQASERQLGVGQDGNVGRIDLVQVFRVGVDMNQLDAVRDRTAVGGVGHPKGVAHGQHRVRLAVDVQSLTRSILAPGIHAATQ